MLGIDRKYEGTLGKVDVVIQSELLVSLEVHPEVASQFLPSRLAEVDCNGLRDESVGLDPELELSELYAACVVDLDCV